jgi:release factor glutamine methyltransferase
MKSPSLHPVAHIVRPRDAHLASRPRGTQLASSSSVEAALRNAQLELRRSSTPQLDAEVLLAFVTRRTRTQLRATPERPLTPDEHGEFRRLIERRSRGEPIAHLTGTREFWSLELSVNANVLVPRPETELAVERALLHMRSPEARALDLGTGSGAIALAIARERPSSSVVATDASPAALEVAKHNACQLGLAHIEFRDGDWFGALRDRERFDVIISNPPYIAEGDPELAADVIAYEPRQALIAGASGMEAIEAIITSAARHLQAGGWLILEHGVRQAVPVRQLLEQAGFISVASHADLAGIERVSEGQWPASCEYRDRHT